MLVEATCKFKDLDCGVMREEGDRFEVSPARLAVINGTRFGQLAREVPEAPPEATGGTSEVSTAKARARRPSKAASK